jgi:hypothetical protein
LFVTLLNLHLGGKIIVYIVIVVLSGWWVLRALRSGSYKYYRPVSGSATLRLWLPF